MCEGLRSWPAAGRTAPCPARGPVDGSGADLLSSWQRPPSWLGLSQRVQASVIGQAPPQEAHTRRGWSVALSADASVALVGAEYANNDAGEVYFFARSGSTWSLAPSVPEPWTDTGFFGYSVALSADVLTGAAVGAEGANQGYRGGHAGTPAPSASAASTLKIHLHLHPPPGRISHYTARGLSGHYHERTLASGLVVMPAARRRQWLVSASTYRAGAPPNSTSVPRSCRLRVRHLVAEGLS